MSVLDQERRETQVKKIEKNSQIHKERLMARIENSHSHQGARLKARLAARTKVKKAKALEKCQTFATLDTQSIAEIVDNMGYREMEGIICKEGDPANEMYIIVEGSCRVTIHGEHVAKLNELAVFGESAIFEENAKRNVTVAGNIKAFVMSRSNCYMLLKSGILSPASVGAIKAVRDERSNLNMGL